MTQITQSQPTSRCATPTVATVVPAVNIHQNSDGYVLEVELPGVARDGVEVTFEDGRLVLLGRKDRPETAGTAVYREIDSADYRRAFDLDPSIDASRIEASVDQGLLTVRLPRAEAAKPRKIVVS